MPATPPATATDANVRDYIRLQLKLRKESKASLGRAIKLSPFQLNRRFNGSFPFQTDEVVRIAKHWDVTVQEVLDGQGLAREES